MPRRKTTISAADRRDGKVPLKPAKGKQPVTCEITRGNFFAAAKPLTVYIGEQGKEPVAIGIAQVRNFDKGGFGFGLYGKVPLVLSGKVVRLQLSLNAPVVNGRYAQD